MTSGEVTPEILIRNIRIHQKEIDRLVTALAEKLAPAPREAEEQGALGWRRVLVGERAGQMLRVALETRNGVTLEVEGGRVFYHHDEVEVWLTGVGMSRTEWEAREMQAAPFVRRIRELRSDSFGRLGLREARQAAIDEAHEQAIIVNASRQLISNKPLPY